LIILKTKIFCVILFFCFAINKSNQAEAQDSSGLNISKDLKISAYVDAYYSYDTDKKNSLKQFSTYSPYRDQIKLNIAQFSLKYTSEKENIRGVFTIQYGDIPDLNWKPTTNFSNIQEANIGFSPVKNLWIDAGYFLSHIGAEGLPKDDYFTSIALISVEEPNPQSGVRIMYDFSEKFSAGLHIINGFNLYEDNNKNKTFGLQLNYKLTPDISLGFNNLMGNEMPAGTGGKLLTLNNLIVNASPYKNLELLVNMDIGTQEKSKLSDSNATAYLYGGFIAARYKFSKIFSTSVRGEFYQDPDGILSGIVLNNMGLKANAITLGVEYKPAENAYVRFEYTYLRLDESLRVFYNNDNQRHEATFSMGIEY